MLTPMTNTDVHTPVTLTTDELGVIADARWRELDRERLIPQDLHEAAAAAGLFRQLVAPALGGDGRAPLDWFRTGMALARHEASLAWVVTQGAAELGWIAAGGDPAWAAEVLADPLGTSASTTAGLGRLVPDGDGARFSGRWAFNTGCLSATWIGGLALVDGQTGSDGMPDVRLGWVPAARATIVDDWDPPGMRGTGSHSTVIEEQTIPLAWTLNPFAPTENERRAHRCLVGNGNWPIATSVAAVQLGNARRALDEARAVIVAKAPPPDFVRLADSGAVQRQLVQAEGYWQAGVATVERELESMWAEATLLEELSSDTRVALHRAALTADHLATRAVELACELSGTAWLAPDAVLGRCRRDALALHGHISVNGMSAEHTAKVDLASITTSILV
jgi:alkylation response protein AidB-like acyl-CoA dehydrogenase